MHQPAWIRMDAVDRIHGRSIDLFGGSHGVLNASALESALMRPQNVWHYTTPKPDLATLAAVLAHGVVKAHAYVDGNKRTAWVLCRLMLRLNGVEVQATESDRIHAMLALAAGAWNEQNFAVWLRSNTRRIVES